MLGCVQDFVQAAIKNKMVQYDREVLSTGYPYSQTSGGEGGIDLNINASSLDTLRDRGGNQLATIESNGKGTLKGSCREIAAAVAEFLEMRGFVDAAKVLAVADGKEYHYGVLGVIEQEDGSRKRVFVDLGYMQPMPIALTVGEPQESEFYGPAEKSKGQIYGGKVTYRAELEGGVLRYRIIDADGKTIKDMVFQDALALDRGIIKKFPTVTDKNTRTEVVEDQETGLHQLKRTDVTGETPFATLHNLMKESKAALNSVTVSYDDPIVLF